MEEDQEFQIAIDDVQLVDKANPGADVCPSCGSTNWYIVQGPGQALPVLPMGLPHGTEPKGDGHSLVTLACQRCGYLKSHIRVIFDTYAKALRGEDRDGN